MNEDDCVQIFNSQKDKIFFVQVQKVVQVTTVKNDDKEFTSLWIQCRQFVTSNTQQPFGTREYMELECLNEIDFVPLNWTGYKVRIKVCSKMKA